MKHLLLKKICSIVLAALIIITAAGIGTAAMAEEKVSKTKVLVWHTFSGNEKKVFEKEIVSAFNKSHDDIRIMPVAMDCALATVLSMEAEHKAPDILVMPVDRIGSFTGENLLENLADEEGFDAVKASQFAILYDLMGEEDGCYAIPFNTLIDVAVYNQAALGGADAPATLEELAALQKTVAVSACDAGSLLPLFLNAGGAVMDDGYTTAVGYLDGENSVKALETLASMKDLFHVCEEGTSPLSGVVAGEDLMAVTNSKAFSVDGIGTDGLVAAVVPTANRAAAGSVIDCEAATVLASSKVKEQAWQFVQYLAGEEAQGILAKCGDLPANVTAAQNVDASVNPFAGAYFEAMNGARMSVVDREQNAVMGFMDRAFEKAMNGIKAPKDVLTLCASQIDAVLNGTEIPQDEDDVILEAENGIFSGITRTADSEAASGGKYVIGLDWGNGEPNKIVYENVPVDKRGTYELKICYMSAMTGKIGVKVNGVRVPCAYTPTDPNWNFVPNIVSINIPLKGDGTDALEFCDYDATAYAGIDYVQLIYKSDVYEELTEGGVQEEVIVDDGRVEFESGELTGTAVANPQGGASGDMIVTGIDPAPGTPNKVIFKNLPVEKEGNYILKVTYSTVMDGTLEVFVNDVSMDLDWYLTDTTGTWAYAAGEVALEIPLKGDGTDTIEFAIKNPYTYLMLDYFKLEYVDKGLILEAEDGTLFGGSRVAESSDASNGKYIIGLDWAEGEPNKIVFENVPVEKSGAYELRICYMSAMSGNIGVKVNGERVPCAYTPTDPYWNFVPNIVSIEVSLNGGGTDSLEFCDYDAAAYAGIDYVQLLSLEGRVAESVEPKGDPADNRIEFESGELTGTAVANPQGGASGDMIVTGIDPAPDTPNKVIFKNLPVEKEGLYTLKVTYSTVMDGTLEVIVNGISMDLDWYLTDKTATWAYVAGEVSLDIPLKGDGSDIIEFAIKNPFTYLMLDYFKIDEVKEGLILEAEEGNLFGGTRFAESEDASNGKYIIGLDWAEGEPNKIAFENVAVKECGTYELRICYMSAMSGNIGVKVNGVRVPCAYTPTDPYWNFVPNIVSINIPLKGDGTDVLEFCDYDATAYAGIDYVQLIYVNDEYTELAQ